MANERDREIWDDATNAVCQAMQEQKMCNCPDGDCLAAKIDFSPEKIATATRPAPAEDEVTIPRNPTEAMMDAGLYHCSHDMEWSDLFTAWQAMFDTVTLDGGMTEHAKASPAPAATDTGLKTIGFVPPMFVEGKGADYNDIFRSVSIAENYTAVVTRSQAEKLLAEKDARIKALEWKAHNAALSNKIGEDSAPMLWSEYAETLEAKLAAQAARIKELETERTMIVSHATMGQTDGIGLTVNDISVRVSALRNELYEVGRKQAEALGARIMELDQRCADWSKSYAKKCSDYEALKRHAEALEAKLAAATADSELLDALQHESWDLRCFDIPTGGGDAEIGWCVVGHWQAKPHERTVAEVFSDNPRAAIRAAVGGK